MLFSNFLALYFTNKLATLIMHVPDFAIFSRVFYFVSLSFYSRFKYKAFTDIERPYQKIKN